MDTLGTFWVVIIILTVILGLVLNGSSQSLVPLDSVNIGDATSESGHNLVGWTDVWTCGPFNVANKTGDWCACHDGGAGVGNMRLIWGDGGETCDTANNWASVDLDVNCNWAQTLKVEHLDGSADDGFNVYVNNTYVGTYEDQYPSNTWTETEFNISSGNYTGLLTIKLEATAPAWGGCGTYGQVAFNLIELYGGPVSATVDIDPDELNLDAGGKWITAYIELPTGYDVNDINITSVELWIWDSSASVMAQPKPTKIGDHDVNGIPDLMVKFDRAAVASWFEQGDTKLLTLTGTVGGIYFEGSDTITTITED